MNQATKLLLAFGAAAVVSDMLSKSIFSGGIDPQKVGSFHALQGFVGIVAVGGAAFAWSELSSPLASSKSLSLQAAIASGVASGILVASVGAPVAGQSDAQLALSAQSAPKLAT